MGPNEGWMVNVEGELKRTRDELTAQAINTLAIQGQGNYDLPSRIQPPNQSSTSDWIWIRLTAKTTINGQIFYSWREQVKLFTPAGFLWVDSGNGSTFVDYPAAGLNNEDLSVTDGKRYPARWNPDTSQWIFFLKASATPPTPSAPDWVDALSVQLISLTVSNITVYTSPLSTTVDIVDDVYFPPGLNSFFDIPSNTSQSRLFQPLVLTKNGAGGTIPGYTTTLFSNFVLVDSSKIIGNVQLGYNGFYNSTIFKAEMSLYANITPRIVNNYITGQNMTSILPVKGTSGNITVTGQSYYGGTAASTGLYKQVYGLTSVTKISW